MTVHGLLQKSRLDAERLPYRIKPLRNGWFRIVKPCKTGETHIRWFNTMEDAETFLMRKLSVEA
jgi:hypothetical protein